MVKVVLTTGKDGYISQVETRIRDGNTPVEAADTLLSRIIPGISKLQDGALLYRCVVDTDADGYVTGAGTDPAGDTDLYADELATLVPGATKLTGGHLVLDADKASEIDAELAKPVATEQDTINANLLKGMAQSQLANAALLKQMATIKAEVTA